MTRLLLIRHAEKQQGYIDKYIDDQLMLGDKNTPLSENGKSQTLRLIKCLLNSGATAVISSDYLRARETAYYISSHLAIPLKIDSRIGERVRRKSRATLMPDDFRIQQYRDMKLKCYDGESMLEVISRFSDCIYEIISKYDNETIILVSHRTAITMFLSQFCTIALSDKVELFFDGTKVFDGNWSGGPDTFDIEMDKKHSIGRIIFQRYTPVDVSKEDSVKQMTFD